MKVNFKSYGDYSSNNYGVNSLVFTDYNGNQFYYSYKTLVAFYTDGKLFVIKNYWNTTTGKHLNWIDDGDKKNRLTQEEFDAECNKYFGGSND